MSNINHFLLLITIIIFLLAINAVISYYTHIRYVKNQKKMIDQMSEDISNDIHDVSEILMELGRRLSVLERRNTKLTKWLDMLMIQVKRIDDGIEYKKIEPTDEDLDKYFREKE